MSRSVASRRSGLALGCILERACPCVGAGSRLGGPQPEGETNTKAHAQGVA